MTATGLSVADYVAHRKAKGLKGATDKQIRAAIRSGRITANEHGRIEDPAQADREWEENRTHSVGNVPQGGGSPKLPSIVESRQRLAVIDVALKDLEYQRKRKDLVRRRDVEMEGSRIGQMLSARLAAVPARVAPTVIGLTELRDVERAISEELAEVIRTVNMEFAKLGGGEAS